MSMLASSLCNMKLCLQRRTFSNLITKGKKSFPGIAKSEVVVKKSEIKQSPLRMKFLVMLIRDRWVPDALAQMKFSPKHRCADVAQIINRACAVSKLHHDTIPSELKIKEVMITKGHAQKKLRIMGRGRAGFGYKRQSHITIRVEKIDFEKCIADAKSYTQKQLWIKRWETVKALKAEGSSGTTNLTPSAPTTSA